jgi:hypothetical protein
VSKCQSCSIELEQRSNERDRVFKKRKYCSNKCKVMAFRKKEHWRSDGNRRKDLYLGRTPRGY